MEETVTIKVENLKKAAELAGGHADVIKALAPEVFEPEVHDEVGSIYDHYGYTYMVIRNADVNRMLVNIDRGCQGYYDHSDTGKQQLRSPVLFRDHLAEMLKKGHLKYLGHQRDIMTIKR